MKLAHIGSTCLLFIGELAQSDVLDAVPYDDFPLPLGKGRREMEDVLPKRGLWIAKARLLAFVFAAIDRENRQEDCRCLRAVERCLRW